MSPGPTVQPDLDENMFERVCTHFKVHIGLFLVQKCPFGTHLPQDVENLWKNNHNLWSKNAILGPICPKMWIIISGKDNQKWMVIGLLCQLFKPVGMQFFWKELDPF
jgi:hypothetical protein